MLDFYLIADEQAKPGWPEQGKLEFAGGLEEEVFERLKTKGFIESRFDYYTDFRWSKAVVQRIHERVKKEGTAKDANAQLFSALLDKALAAGCGLIAYCD